MTNKKIKEMVGKLIRDFTMVGIHRTKSEVRRRLMELVTLVKSEAYYENISDMNFREVIESIIKHELL